MIVLDSSAALEALVGQPVDPVLFERITSAREIHAPHLIDVEVLSGLRRLVRLGLVDPNRASDARRDLGDLAIIRYPHTLLLDRMWSLRENLSAYDAAFVALAESLQMPVITCDARLARAPGHTASFELFAVSSRTAPASRRRSGTPGKRPGKRPR